MGIRRLLALGLAAGALAGCQMDGPHGDDATGGMVADDGVVPSGAIPAADDTRPGVEQQAGQETQVDSAIAVRPGAPQEVPVVTPLPPADTTPR